MRILITTEFYLPLQCGITTAILNEKKVLEEKGHEVRILTIYDKKKSTYKDGVYYFRSNFPQLYQDSYATIVINDPLFEDIYEWHPDIVHSQCEFFTMFIAKKIVRKLNIPLVHTCHTDFDAYGIHFTKSDRLWDWATSTFIPRFLKGVDYIICPTNKNYDLLKRYGTKNPMIIIPCGLDLNYLSGIMSAEERTVLRKRYGINDSDVVLLSVCRLSKEKNVKESIEHFHSLLRVRGNIKLLIVGDGEERENLEAQVKALDLENKVSFTGNIAMNEIWKYYKAGDIFISSSTSEIQGLTYIEALASSLPIVCRRDHSLDMSLIYGVNGYDFSDDSEFIERIIPLIDDPELRKRMGKNAKESVEKYSLENFAENLLRIFNKVLSEKTI